jgi:hypothetical protein
MISNYNEYLISQEFAKKFGESLDEFLTMSFGLDETELKKKL